MSQAPSTFRSTPLHRSGARSIYSLMEPAGGAKFQSTVRADESTEFSSGYHASDVAGIVDNPEIYTFSAWERPAFSMHGPAVTVGDKGSQWGMRFRVAPNWTLRCHYWKLRLFGPRLQPVDVSDRYTEQTRVGPGFLKGGYPVEGAMARKKYLRHGIIWDSERVARRPKRLRRRPSGAKSAAPFRTCK
jgi:hypothetical protein